MRRDEFDVIVVGLGPAGARAAAAAARRGCRVLGLERKTIAGQPVQCAELVPALIGQDAADFMRHRAQAVRRMLTCVEQAENDERAPFPGHIIDRARFDAGELERAQAAGAGCRLGTAVRRIDGARIELADGTTVSAPVIIGADGPLSRVGRSVGLSNRELVCAQQVSVALTRPHDATDIFLSAGYSGGYGWLFPKGERAHVGVGVAFEQRNGCRGKLAALHDRLVARGRVGAEVLARTGGLIAVGGALTPFAVRADGLTLLAGDAAGLSNPVTGAGIHAALVSGELAGAAAADWLTGVCDAASAYAEELDDVFGAALARAHSRRVDLLHAARRRRPRADDLRRAWIAFPEYWQDKLPLSPTEVSV